MYNQEILRLFGPIWLASGSGNFFGEGWSYHHWPIMRNFIDFNGVTFVAKTTTVGKRERVEGGNMDLVKKGKSWVPKKLFPGCVYISPRSWINGVMLNAVGLSGPGAKALFETEQWQARTDPFMLSFMSLGDLAKQLEEFERFCKIFQNYHMYFCATVGLQLNVSCPNVVHNQSDLIGSIRPLLDLAATLGIPVGIKVVVTMSPKTVAELAKHPACSFIVVTNTLPWGQLPEKVNWKRLFGTETSPLIKRGYTGGGLSGKPLLPLVIEWIKEFREHDTRTHINAGGGILHPRDVLKLKSASADSVSIGTVPIFRPWRVKRIIRTAHKIF